MCPDKLCLPAQYSGVTERRYIEGILQRTREARERAGLSQAQIAAALRIGTTTYKQYEHRSPLPHYLIEAFCLLTKTDIHYFVIGRRYVASAAQEGLGKQAPARPPKRAAERRQASV